MALASAGVVDLSDMKLERVSPEDLAPAPATQVTELNFHHHGRCTKSAGQREASSPPAPPVRCLILKNNRLVYLPSSLFARRAAPAGASPGLELDEEEDEEDGPLRGLRVLDVANNRLASVPSTIGQLASLTVLNLTSNRLTSLPPEIGRLANLRDLYVGGNELTSLPDQIGSCRGLRRLYLTSNPLRSLPLGLGSLEDELIVLELSGAQAKLTFPPKAVVRKGIQAILAHLAQAKADHSRKESLERRRAVLASFRDAAEDGKSGVELETQRWKQDKERLKEEMKRMERSARLTEIQNKRLELDKEQLQRKMIDLVVDNRRMQQRLKDLEERASREEIRRQCVVCMDHTRSHIFLPCRHYVVCQHCAANVRVCPVCRSPITQRLQVFDV